MSDEQSVRRSERLRGRESRSASVEVLVQRDSPVEVISSVESSATTEDQSAATVTSSSSSQRRKTPTPVSSVSSSRRISSLRRRVSNESSGENTKDSDDPTTPQTSKTPSRQRSSARKERGVSVESNSSADGSVKSASSSTTPRRRRRTIGVVSEPLVEVINEEDESAERSQEDADIIAYHTRSHGPSEEVAELDAVIKRPSALRQSQDGQSSAGGSEQSVEAEDATMGSSIEGGFALTLETLSQEEITKYIASSSSSLQSDMDTKLASDNAEGSSQDASTKSDVADKDSDAEGSRKQQNDTTVSSAIIMSQTESNHSLESLSVPHLESHEPSDVVPTEIADDSRGKGGKVNVDEANDEQFTKGIENDEQQSELRMQSISAVNNELVTVRCEENVIDERIDRHASEESLQMSTEDSSVPIIGEDSGGALKSPAKTDKRADNIDGDARTDTQLSLNEEEHRCKEQKSSLLAEETDRSHADKDVELVMKEANEAGDKMSSSEVVTETVEEQSVLKERTPEHDQMNDSGQQMELVSEEKKKREIESEKSKNECESKNVSENASGNVDEEVESVATDKHSECWPSISDASSIWHKRNLLINSMSSGYELLTSFGECDVNNLPNELWTGDTETIWQQIAARNKKLRKRFKKYKSLFQIAVPKTKKVSKRKEVEKRAEQIQFQEDEGDDEEMNRENEGSEEGVSADEGNEQKDLFNLKPEDLEDLEKELNEMEDEGSEKEETDENDQQEEMSEKKPKKFRKTIVDDRFFSLAEMEEYLDREERQDTSEGFFDDVQEDGREVGAGYRYTDFFGGDVEIDDDAKKGKLKKKKKAVERDGEEERIEENDGKGKKKKKSVRFADENDDDAEMSGEEGDDEQIDEDQHPVLLGSVDDGKIEESEFEKRQKKIRSKIEQLEEANLRPQKWQMTGEVSALERDENTLLEQHVAYDHSAKSAPIITVDSTAKLEALIIQRIKDKAFDDVERKVREPESETKYRAPVEEPLVKKSLAEVYEEQYQKTQQGETNEVKKDEKVANIEKLMDDLFKKLDALSHYKYIPPEVRPEVRIVSNIASLRKEEVGPMASTDDVLMAPEEVKRHEKGEVKSKEERSDTDRARERRKKKKMQRMSELKKRLHDGEQRGSDERMTTEGEPKKKKKNKLGKGSEFDGGSTGGVASENIKSTTFFKKLQQTVQSEINEKSNKELKKTKRNASAKYVL